VKPKKCRECEYLARNYLINEKLKFRIRTRRGRTKFQYICKKYNATPLTFWVEDKCGGPFMEEKNNVAE
jgi:hypothetical protein